jgi:hypothetical protein
MSGIDSAVEDDLIGLGGASYTRWYTFNETIWHWLLVILVLSLQVSRASIGAV